ncbi:MAG: glycosyltransferase family 2 protein [bacterium]|nr:glycosyltransferase family 2 protein [bacterium]
MTVSVAVVTANRAQVLDACLGSLERSEYPIAELLVFDNGSRDETPELVGAKYPRARLIRHERNMGLTYCHNRAMEEFRGEALFLLDDDNEVAPDMLGLLVKYLEEPGHERVGIVVPLVMDYYNRQVVVVPGGHTSLWSGRNILNPKEVEEGRKYYTTQRVPNSTLIRRVCVERFGLMDERMFSTLADEDYVRRMNRGGWEAHVVIAARTYHKQKVVGDVARRYGMTNPARVYILARNRTVLVRRYARWYQLVVYLTFWHTVYMAFYLAVLAVWVRRVRYVGAYLRGVRDGFRYVFTGELPPLEYVLKLAEGR